MIPSKELSEFAFARCGVTTNGIHYNIEKLDVGQYLLLASTNHGHEIIHVYEITKVISDNEYLIVPIHISVLKSVPYVQLKLCFNAKPYYDYKFSRVKVFSDYEEFLLTEGLGIG